MISFVGLISMLAGILLMGVGVRIGKSSLDRDDPEWRANADRIYKVLTKGGAMLAGLGFLLIIGRFLLSYLGVSIE
jgi:hypothetical protein